MTTWSKDFEAVVRSHLLTADRDISLTPNSSFSELELDSLSVMSLLTALEQHFNRMLPGHALDQGLDTTLGSLWTHFLEIQSS